MTVNGCKVKFCRNLASFRDFWEPTAAKRMKIGLQCVRRNCSSLDVLFNGV